MQYQFIVFVLLLLLSPYTYSNDSKTPSIGSFAVPGCLVLLLLPIGISNALSASGQYERAHRIYPFDTDISVRMMLEQPALPQAAAIAHDILKLDPYEATSWRILAEAAMDNRQYKTAMEAMRQVVTLNKYDRQIYDEAMRYCLRALDDGEAADAMVQEMAWLVNKMEDTIEKTDRLGYKLPDKPDLKFPAETMLQLHLLERIVADR